MEEEKLVRLSAVVSVGFSATLKLSARVYLSMAHVAGACSSALRAKSLEDSKNSAASLEHSGCVASCIVGCAAFLEASINEFFCDCADDPRGPDALGDEAVRWIGRYWELGFPRTAAFKILEKYELALTILGKGTLDLGRAPGQQVKALINLRNALTHYEPEWQSSGDEAHKIEKQLKGQFAPNPLTGLGNPFWPSQCLGYGCCKWAVKAVLDFHQQFWIQLGLPGRHSHVYKELPVLP
ncbi:MAG: hypothetical protein WB579_18100 [Bryobacteraceae bacterium]